MRIQAAGISEGVENFCQAAWRQTYCFIIVDNSLKSHKAYCYLLEPDAGG